MSLYNYVDVPNSNLVCCICQMPFMDPTTTQTCAHTFCRDCILRAIDHAAQCPVDRSPLVASGLAPANPIVRSLVDELVVECVHKEEGCAYTCQRQFLATHLQEECMYREVSCPQGMCGVMMMHKDRELHTHEGEDDTKDTPPAEESLVEEETTAETQESAAETEPAIASDPRFAALAEQNLLLRRRVESLESLVETFRREMVAVKGALGPWFRVGNSARHSYYSAEMPSGVQHLTASTSSGPPRVVEGAAGGYAYPYPVAYPTSPTVDSLAPYFPSEVEEHPVRRPAGGLHRAGVGSISGQAHEGPYGFGPPPPPHAYTIAPLDLSTTLEGTLGGLRESVVGLAAGVDSMGRRQEIALTNETMRLGEEVGGLRAGVHGLRMQVHAIMMDRNAQITGRDEATGAWVPPPQQQGRMYYPQPGSITKL